MCRAQGRKAFLRFNFHQVRVYVEYVQMRGKEDLLMLWVRLCYLTVTWAMFIPRASVHTRTVTVRGCAGPISKVERHISERSRATL